MFIVATMLLIGAVIALAVGRIGGGLDAPASSLPARGLPAPPDGTPGPIGSREVAAVRFSPALRGYRMDEVDAVLDALGDRLDAQADRIAELEAMVDGAGTATAAIPIRSADWQPAPEWPGRSR